MNIIFQSTALVRYSLRRFDRVHERVFQNRHLFSFMLSLQLLWLVTIAWTGASTNWSKLSLLAIYSLLAEVVVVFLPAAFILKFRDFKNWLLQKESRLIFVLCLIALLAGAFYATHHKLWSDESKSFSTAQNLAAEGLEFSYMESGWLRKRHPPLVPLTYGLALNLLGENLLYLRFISVLFLMATMPIVYLLGRDLYDRETGYLASLLFLSFPLVIRLGSSAMMDTQLAFFFTLSLLLGLRLLRRSSYRLALALGIVIGLGLLTKYIMVLVYGVLLGFLFFKPDLRKLKYHLALALLISASILALWLSYAYHLGILTEQIQKIADYSGIYHVIKDVTVNPQLPQADVPESGTGTTFSLANNRILQLGLETLFTRLPSALGIHHLPLIVFGLMFLLRRRKPADLFVLLWIAIVFVILFLTLPDHRYFLATFPAIAILIARSFVRFPEGQERVLLLCLLFGAGNLYLFVDWVREAHIFLLPL